MNSIHENQKTIDDEIKRTSEESDRHMIAIYENKFADGSITDEEKEKYSQLKDIYFKDQEETIPEEVAKEADGFEESSEQSQ